MNNTERNSARIWELSSHTLCCSYYLALKHLIGLIILSDFDYISFVDCN